MTHTMALPALLPAGAIDTAGTTPDPEQPRKSRFARTGHVGNQDAPR